MRLAGPEHLPAEALVLGGDAAGAQQLHGADVDHQIRIGAHEGQLARHALLDQRAVIRHGLVAVVF